MLARWGWPLNISISFVDYRERVQGTSPSTQAIIVACPYITISSEVQCKADFTSEWIVPWLDTLCTLWCTRLEHASNSGAISLGRPPTILIACIFLSVSIVTIVIFHSSQYIYFILNHHNKKNYDDQWILWGCSVPDFTLGSLSYNTINSHWLQS